MTREAAKEYARKLGALIAKPQSILAACYALVAVLISIGVDSYKSSRQEYEKRVTDRVITFIDSTREFDALVPTLAHGIMDKNGPDLEARQKLVTNLNRQYSEVNELAPLLKKNNQVVDLYKKSISDLNNQILTTNSMEEMKKYWESVGNVLHVRKELTSELRKSANLDYR